MGARNPVEPDFNAVDDSTDEPSAFRISARQLLIYGGVIACLLALLIILLIDI